MPSLPIRPTRHCWPSRRSSFSTRSCAECRRPGHRRGPEFLFWPRPQRHDRSIATIDRGRRDATGNRSTGVDRWGNRLQFARAALVDRGPDRCGPATADGALSIAGHGHSRRGAAARSAFPPPTWPPSIRCFPASACMPDSPGTRGVVAGRGQRRPEPHLRRTCSQAGSAPARLFRNALWPTFGG